MYLWYFFLGEHAANPVDQQNILITAKKELTIVNLHNPVWAPFVSFRKFYHHLVCDFSQSLPVRRSEMTSRTHTSTHSHNNIPTLRALYKSRQARNEITTWNISNMRWDLVESKFFWSYLCLAMQLRENIEGNF